eukprot:4354965-Alexandrium_andersonii.AAC.1
MALATARLLRAPTKDEKQVLACQSRLKLMSRLCPEQASGRQAFFADLCKRAVDRHGPAGRDMKRVRKARMKRHVADFRAQAAATRDRYRALAQVQAAERRQELSHRQAEVAADLRAARARMSKSMLDRGPLLLSSSSWGEWELGLFQDLYNGEQFAGPELHHLRDSACQAPPDFSPSLVSALEEQPVPEFDEILALPAWLKSVV